MAWNCRINNGDVDEVYEDSEMLDFIARDVTSTVKEISLAVASTTPYTGNVMLDYFSLVSLCHLFCRNMSITKITSPTFCVVIETTNFPLVIIKKHVLTKYENPDDHLSESVNAVMVREAESDGTYSFIPVIEVNTNMPITRLLKVPPFKKLNV